MKTIELTESEREMVKSSPIAAIKVVCFRTSCTLQASIHQRRFDRARRLLEAVIERI